MTQNFSYLDQQMAKAEKQSAPAEKSTFQRVKDAVSNGVQMAINYIPKGILFTGMLMASSYALGQVGTGMDIMHIDGASAGQLATKGLSFLAVGTLASFGFGTVMGGLGTGASTIQPLSTPNTPAPPQAGISPVISPTLSPTPGLPPPSVNIGATPLPPR